MIESNPARTDAANGEAPFDPSTLLAVCDGDIDLARQLALVFQGECPRMLDQLRRGVGACDARAVCLAAHEFKGAISNFGDSAAHDSAFALERMGSEADLVGGAAEFARFEREIGRLDKALMNFINQAGAP